MARKSVAGLFGLFGFSPSDGSNAACSGGARAAGGWRFAENTYKPDVPVTVDGLTVTVTLPQAAIGLSHWEPGGGSPPEQEKRRWAKYSQQWIGADESDGAYAARLAAWHDERRRQADAWRGELIAFVAERVGLELSPTVLADACCQTRAAMTDFEARWQTSYDAVAASEQLFIAT